MALSGWDLTKRFQLSVAASDVDSNLTDFPVLVKLSGSSGKTGFDLSAVFSELGSSSHKIAVEVGDSGVQCYVEIDLWDNAGGVAYLWVKIPAVSSSADTILNLYYDSTQPDNNTYVGDTGSAAAQSVWDANFLIVYHMGQDPTDGVGVILDSTANLNHATTVGSMTSADLVPGLIGNAVEFDGVDDHAERAIVTPTSGNTVEMLWKSISSNASEALHSTGTTTGDSNPYQVLQNNASSLREYTATGWTAIGVAALDTWYYSAIARDATTSTYYLNYDTYSASHSGTTGGNNTKIFIAVGYSARPNILCCEYRLSSTVRSSGWVKLTNLSYTDLLLTFALSGSIITHRVVMDMPYGDLIAEHRPYVDMLYAVLFSRLAYVDQIYGIKLGAMLTMYYGDCPTLRHIVRQYYGDCSILRRSMVMKYGDLLMLRRSVEMPYVIPRELRSVIEARYSIAGEAVRAFIDQGYDLLDNNLLRQKLEQIYMIQGDGLVKSVGAQVTIGGRVVRCSHVNVESSLDQYCISGEIHLADQAEYVQIADGEEMIISIDADGGVDSYHLIVDAKRRSRPGGAKITYIVTGLSPAVKLSAPWSLPLLQEFEPGQARDIVNDLVGDLGPVDWQIVDFPVLPDTLYANDEDPITVIRKLTRSAGAVIQSAPNGTIRIVPAYPTSPPQWAEVEPDFYLTERDLVTQDETPVRNPGYNKYLVGNQLSTDDRKWTEKRDVTGSIKEVLAFQTPWDWYLPVVLDHSGGEWVYLPEYMGVVEEIYPPADQPAEQVEFVAGFANTSRPIYAVPEVNWIREQLGAVSYSEDGKLEAELKTGATDGYSLAEIRYLTRYHLWRVRDDVAEDVQYILRVADEVVA